MAKRLLLYVVSAWLVGCNKQPDATLNPDLTLGLTGAYPLTYYRNGTQMIDLPTNSLSGVFDVTKIDLTHLNVQLSFNFSGSSSILSVNTVELTRDQQDPNQYRMMKSGRTVGTITPTNLEVNDISADSIVVQIKAKR